MSDEILLKMENICKNFPGVTALDRVDFELRTGEVHILLGENGAGKSTLVKILSGACQKSSGEISLAGEKIEIRSPRHAQETGISIIYQEFNLIPQLTVAENIFLGRESAILPGLINRDEMRTKAGAIMSELGVNINPDSAVTSLGVAEQQMVEVAKALSMDARILIMDEPTSALTEKEISDLFTMIRRLKEKSVSIIYISHRMEELFEIGDRVTVLRDGRIIGTRNISDVTTPDLIRMMVDRELTDQYPRQKTEKGSEKLQLEDISTGALLRNISFRLYAGEILGVAGLLGSGRTELARAIFGLDRISAGRIFINGVEQKIKSAGRAIGLRIGYLTEDRKRQGLILNLSVKDNICLPSVDRFSHFGVVSHKYENYAAKKWISELNIKTPGSGQKVVNLSGGNQQKVVIAKWLCSQADILIFDEPTRGIDVGSKVEIYELMNQLSAAGASILMISSDLPEILGMSDRILVMYYGRISAEYQAADASQEKILQSALGAA